MDISLVGLWISWNQALRFKKSMSYFYCTPIRGLFEIFEIYSLSLFAYETSLDWMRSAWLTFYGKWWDVISTTHLESHTFFGNGCKMFLHSMTWTQIELFTSSLRKTAQKKIESIKRIRNKNHRPLTRTSQDSETVNCLMNFKFCRSIQ